MSNARTTAYRIPRLSESPLDVDSLNQDVVALSERLDVLYTANNHVKAINHRGYSVTAPENTLPAFQLSRQIGFFYVECDVSFTKDNVPVLLHDVTINRTARKKDGSQLITKIRIHDITYEEALSYDFGIWKNSNYINTPIPTFYEFIALCRNLGMHPYIEMKSSKDYTKAQIESLVTIVNSYGILKNVTWISFNADYLGYIKNCNCQARLGYVVEQITPDVISTAGALQNALNEVFISSNYSLLNDELIQLCINNLIPLEVWTVNDADTLLALHPYISGVTSDHLIAGKVLYQAYIM